MTTYARRWRGACLLVVALGLGLAMLLWSAIYAVVAAAVIGALAAAVLALARRDDGGTRSPADGRVRLAARSATAGAAGVALWAALTLSPPLAALTLVLAVGGSPWTIDHVRRVVRAPRDRTAVPVVAVEVPPSPWDDYDDRALCRLWRLSFWRLGPATSPDHALRVVALRAACLEELERRNAAAVQAWLDSGARASGGPEKFLGATRADGADAA